MALILETLKTHFSYILNCKDIKLRDFVLNQINKQSYFKTRFLRKDYISKNVEYNLIRNMNQQSMNHSISRRIGKIVKELGELELVVKYSNSQRCLWKNLYKNTLFEELNLRGIKL